MWAALVVAGPRVEIARNDLLLHWFSQRQSAQDKDSFDPCRIEEQFVYLLVSGGYAHWYSPGSYRRR